MGTSTAQRFLILNTRPSSRTIQMYTYTCILGVGGSRTLTRMRAGDGCGESDILDAMRTYTFVIEKDADTGLLVGHVPGWPGAHSQGATIEELRQNLREVIEMLLEDGEPRLEAEFVGTETLRVA